MEKETTTTTTKRLELKSRLDAARSKGETKRLELKSRLDAARSKIHKEQYAFYVRKKERKEIQGFVDEAYAALCQNRIANKIAAEND